MLLTEFAHDLGVVFVCQHVRGRKACGGGGCCTAGQRWGADAAPFVSAGWLLTGDCCCVLVLVGAIGACLLIGFAGASWRNLQAW